MSKSLQKHNNGYYQNGNDELSTFSIPNQNQKQGSGGLDPKLIVFTILRYKWLILLFLIMGGVGGWYYANSLEPMYESNGTMLITSEKNNDELKNIVNQTTGVGTDGTLANEMQIIKSRYFAMQVASNLIEDENINEDDLPIFWSELEDGSLRKREIDAVANSIRNGLSVQLTNRDADVIQIGFQSSSPKETATIINTAMSVYVEESTIQNRMAAEQTSQFYEKERARLKEEMEQAEQDLKDYMDQTGIVKVDNQASSAVNRVEGIQQELEDVQLELNSVDRAISNQEEELERLRPGLASDFSNAVAPRINSLQETLQQYEKERYLILQNYPNVRQREEIPQRLIFLDENIEELKENISELSSEIFSEQDEYMGMESSERTQMVSNIQNQLIDLRMQKDQLESRIEVLQDRKAEADREFNEMPKEMVKFAQLERDLAMKEQLYLDISGKYADISTWKETQYGNGRVLDQAIIPSNPVSPNIILITVMGVVLFSMAAGLIISVREFFDNTISSIGTVKANDIPMLAAIPAFKRISVNNGNGLNTYEVGKGSVPNEMVLFRDRSNIVSESIRRLKNNIIFQNSDNVPKTIAVTSSEKGEGKTSIACNLALSFAEEEYKTLIIDTDFRRPRVHTLFGLPNKEGISDLIRGEVAVSKVIQNSDNKYLKVINSGSKLDRPESLVNDKKFGAFLEKMESIFDVIILDTPPFGIISDSTSLLRNADATVMVAKYRKTNRQVYQHTLDELMRINANVCGMVLNGFEPDKDPEAHYSSGYYKSMYEGYKSYV